MAFALNATESSPIDIRKELTANEALVGLEIPAGFIGTSFKLKNSTDGTNFYTVIKADGTDYELVCAASRYVSISPSEVKGLGIIKGVVASQTGGAISLNLVASQVT